MFILTYPGTMTSTPALTEVNARRVFLLFYSMDQYAYFDCFYRNFQQYSVGNKFVKKSTDENMPRQFISFLDVDELTLPQNHTNLHGLFDELQRNDKIKVHFDSVAFPAAFSYGTKPNRTRGASQALLVERIWRSRDVLPNGTYTT